MTIYGQPLIVGRRALSILNSGFGANASTSTCGCQERAHPARPDLSAASFGSKPAALTEVRSTPDAGSPQFKASSGSAAEGRGEKAWGNAPYVVGTTSTKRTGWQRYMQFAGLKGPWIKQVLRVTAKTYELDITKPPDCKKEKYSCKIEVIEFFKVSGGNSSFGGLGVSRTNQAGKSYDPKDPAYTVSGVRQPNSRPKIDVHHFQYDMEAKVRECGQICSLSADLEAEIYDGVTTGENLDPEIVYVFASQTANPGEQPRCACVVDTSDIKTAEWFSGGVIAGKYSYEFLWEECPCPPGEPPDPPGPPHDPLPPAPPPPVDLTPRLRRPGGDVTPSAPYPDRRIVAEFDSAEIGAASAGIPSRFYGLPIIALSAAAFTWGDPAMGPPAGVVFGA